MYLTQLKFFLQHSAIRQMVSLMVVFTIIVAVSGVSMHWLVQKEINNAVDTRLISRMQEAITLLQAGEDLTMLTNQQPTDEQHAMLTNGQWRDGFQTRESKVKTGLHKKTRGESQQFRYLIQTTPYGQILVGENTERQDELLDILASGITITIALTLATTLLIGFWMARNSQKRINIINRGLAKVAQGQLDTRIVLAGRKDDLSLLVDRINSTTERLSSAMQKMRIQSSNIAHDLRTPLARLRAQLEVQQIALTEQGRPVSAADLGTALEQIDHITGTFNALLRLTQIENGTSQTKFMPVNLGAMVEQVATTFTAVVEDAGQTLRTDIRHSATIMGDADMLTQLVINLLQNALRYGASKQTITLGVHGHTLYVNDQGPGIPYAERESVLEPLYQTETTRQSHGYGLGLSIVRAISQLHHATLTLSDGQDNCGLKVSVLFVEK